MVSNLPRGVEEAEEESKKSSQQQQPWLLMNDGKNCSMLQGNMFNNKPPLLYDLVSEIPAFLGRTVGCSFAEWVLLTTADTNLPDVLVNILSKETIELPHLSFTYNFCTLTSHPSDPTCHIVFFCEEDNALIICQPGDKEFTIRKWDYQVFPGGGLIAVVAGKLFLNVRDNSPFCMMVIIEFKESSYRFELIKMEWVGRLTCNEINFYCEYAGELFVVDRIMCGLNSTNVIGFEICKADFLNKKWVPVKKLGGRVAIVIGYGTAVVQPASAESGIKANSIYFLEEDDPYNYYIYSLEEGTIRMKPTFFSSMEKKETTELYWIMMHCDPKLLKGEQESIFQDSEIENRSSGEEMEENSWNMVPLELLNLIQLQLFGRDHAVFRLVCRAWQQVSIGDHSIPALLSSTALLELCQSFPPLLMSQEDISCDSVPIFRFFDPVHRKLYRMGIPELRETDIHYSKDGWLLVSRRSDRSIFFFNPLTQEKIELPRMPSDSCFSTCPYSLSFSSLPTCSNCVVVGISHTILLMYTLKHGEETWRRQLTHRYETEYQAEFGHCPVVLNGLHHFMFFMCENRHMVVFNLQDGVESRFLSKFKRPEYLRVEDFFLEIDGELAFVSISPDGGEISFYKWNVSEMDWKLMEGGVDFGGKKMFLSRKGSFMEKMDDIGGLGNTIFLPMIDDAKEGVFYSLATHRYHTFYSGYSSELPLNVDKFPNAIWVKPDRKIVGDKNLQWFRQMRKWLKKSEKENSWPNLRFP